MTVKERAQKSFRRSMKQKKEREKREQEKREQEKREIEVKKETKIEAYGIKGMKNTKWRKIFKNEDAMMSWAEKHDAEIQGVRDAE